MLFSKKHPERGEGLRLDGAPGRTLRKLSGCGAEPCVCTVRLSFRTIPASEIMRRRAPMSCPWFLSRLFFLSYLSFSGSWGAFLKKAPRAGRGAEPPHMTNGVRGGVPCTFGGVRLWLAMVLSRLFFLSYLSFSGSRGAFL